MSVTMTYGSYTFRPVPLMTMSRKEHRTSDTRIIGKTFTVNCEGTLVAPTGGLPYLDDLSDQLEDGVKCDGRLFLLLCDDEVIISGYPRINDALDFTKSPDNYVFTAPYTMSFEFDDTDTFQGNLEQYDACTVTATSGAYIETFSEDWQLEFGEKAYYNLNLTGSINDVSPLYQARVTHTLNAKGRRRWGPEGLTREAWQNARLYLTNKLGLDTQFVVNSGILNLGIAISGAFDHNRSINISESDGTCQITETWLVLSSGNTVGKPALEEFTITSKTDSNTFITSVSVEGSVQGLEKRDYNTASTYTVSQTKYANASGYFNTVKNRLYNRAQMIYNGINTSAFRLNPRPLLTTVGHSPANGTITYSYEYNSRRDLCLSDYGAISEIITVSDAGLTDIIAELTIPGRGTNLLQSFNTKTNPTRTVSVEAVFVPANTGCPSGASNVASLMGGSPRSAVNALLESFGLDLENNYESVFVTENTFTWNLSTGQVNANRTWKMGSC